MNGDLAPPRCAEQLVAEVVSLDAPPGGIAGDEHRGGDRVEERLELGRTAPGELLAPTQLLGPEVLGQIGGDDAEDRLPVHQGADRQVERDVASIGTLDGHLALALAFPPPAAELVEASEVLRDDVVAQGSPHHLLQRTCQHLGEATIAIEDRAVAGDRRGALVHLLHQHAVGVVRALERVDPRTVRPLDDQRVHLAGGERTQRLLGLLEANAELLQLQVESGRASGGASPLLPEVETEEHPLDVGQVPDVPPERRGKDLDQRGRGEDLLVPRQRSASGRCRPPRARIDPGGASRTRRAPVRWPDPRRGSARSRRA